MGKVPVENLKENLFSHLQKFDGKITNIMISGGSLLSLLNNDKIKNLKTDGWSIYYADERITEDENEINFILSKSFLEKIRGRAYPLNNIDMDMPKMNLILLGIGDDGHICSLFPNHTLLNSERNIDLIEDSPKPPPKRLTVTLKYLNKHEQLYFYLTKEKAKNITEPHISIQNGLVAKMNIIFEK